MEAARGDILFFVDSDVVSMTACRHTLERFFAAIPIMPGSSAAMTTRRPPRPGQPAPQSAAPPCASEIGRAASTFWTGCGALRRADFVAAGGFRREDEMIEDVGLGLRLARLGRPVLLDPELRCTHLKAWSWANFARTDYRHRAQPWTRMMRDPANRDLVHVLNAGARGKAAVVSVGLSVLSLPLLAVSAWLALILAAASLAALAALEWRFLVLAARHGGPADTLVAVAMLWLHYLAAGAGYARVRLVG